MSYHGSCTGIYRSRYLQGSQQGLNSGNFVSAAPRLRVLHHQRVRYL